MLDETLIKRTKQLRKDLRIKTKVINLYNFNLDDGTLVSRKPSRRIVKDGEPANTQRITNELVHLLHKSHSRELGEAVHKREIVYGPDILPILENYMSFCLAHGYIKSYLKGYHTLQKLTKSHCDTWYLVDKGSHLIRNRTDYFSSIRPIKASDVSYTIDDFLEAEKDRK